VQKLSEGSERFFASSGQTSCYPGTTRIWFLSLLNSIPVVTKKKDSGEQPRGATCLQTYIKKNTDYNGFRGSSDPSPAGAAYLWHRQTRSPVRPRRGGIFVAAVNMPPPRGSDVICGGLMLQICRPLRGFACLP